jgi:hypothetical protein
MTTDSFDHIAVEFHDDVAALPLALRELLERERAAGSHILFNGHHHQLPRLVRL